ncbi:MAG: hypothetical protein IKX91_04525, partial [Firmicutes bacterium]|nr:hypothetical protein [Bacillota bacterium]
MNRKELKKELYLYDTHVENFFIGEHLPYAPGDAVKVYLYALMYTDIDRAIRRSELAKALGISPETVDDAWAYWEQRNVIRRIYPDPADRSVYDIEFLRLKELIYGAKGGTMPAAED